MEEEIERIIEQNPIDDCREVDVSVDDRHTVISQTG